LSDAAADFTVDDITVAGGTLSGFVAANTGGKLYTAVFTPTASFSGVGTVSVAAGRFANAFGTTNTAASLTPAMAIDTLVPTVTVTSNRTALKAGQTATLTFVLSETATNFTVDDIAVAAGSGSFSAFTAVGTAGKVYTAVFTPTPGFTGSTGVTVAAGKFTDAAGNPSAAGSLATPITIDALPPGRTILSRTGSTVVVSELEPGTTWKYSLDGGTVWTAGTGSSFELPPSDYPIGRIQVVQTDAAGNDSGAGILAEPLKAVTTAVRSDDFARADGTTAVLGSPAIWTKQFGDLKLQAGRLVSTNLTGSSLVLAGMSPQQNVRAEAQVDLSAALATGSNVGLYVRNTGTGGTTARITGWVTRTSTGFKAEIVRQSNGSTVVLASVPVTSASGLLRLEAHGSQIMLSFDGRLVAAVNDTAATAVTAAGTAGISFLKAEAAVDNYGLTTLTPVATDPTATPAVTLSRSGPIVTLSGLAAGSTWKFTLDGGLTWRSGTGSSFGLAPVSYAAGLIRAVQFDAAGAATALAVLAEAVTVTVTPSRADDFNRADGTTTVLGSPAIWTRQFGDLKLQTGRLVATNTVGSSLVLAGMTAQRDVRAEAQVDLSAAVGTGSNVGLYVRNTGSGSTAARITGWLTRTATGLKAEIVRQSGGTTVVLSSTNVTAASGLLRLEVVGSQITLSYGGTMLASVTDTSAVAVTTAGTAGITFTKADGAVDNYALSSLSQ
jgi:hypothetical protein